MSKERPHDAAHKRRLAVDLSDLEAAFENNSWEISWYLDLETGRVVLVTYEIREILEAIAEEVDAADGTTSADLAELITARDLPEWQQEAIVDAVEVDRGLGVRFIEIPGADSRESYADMKEFIETIEDKRFQAQLARAPRGRRALGRFRDALHDDPAERERWFAFKAQRTRARILAWLESEGIELP